MTGLIFNYRELCVLW